MKQIEKKRLQMVDLLSDCQVSDNQIEDMWKALWADDAQHKVISEFKGAPKPE